MMVDTSTDCAASSTTTTSNGAVWSIHGNPEELSVLNTRWASSWYKYIYHITTTKVLFHYLRSFDPSIKSSVVLRMYYKN